MTQQTSERRRDRSSLQELAKLAQTPPPPSVSDASPLSSRGPVSGVGPASGPLSGPLSGSGPLSSPVSWGAPPSGPWAGAENDSGMVDLKSMAQADPAASQRAQQTPLAAESLFEDPPAGGVPAPSGSHAPLPPTSGMAASIAPAPANVASAPPPSAPVSSAAAPAVSAVAAFPSTAPASKKKEESNKGPVVIFLVGTLAAAAAGVFFWMNTRHKEEAAAAAARAAAQPTVAVVAPAVEKAPEPVAQAAPEPVAAPEQPAAPEPVAAKGSKGKGKKGGEVDNRAPAPVAANVPEPVKDNSADKSSTFMGSLQKEMEKRVGPGEKSGPGVEVADNSRATGGTKPSQGQVTGAIGAVMMEARECLGPDDPVSKANVVFESSGGVKSVSVSGPAAGKPAEGCIKKALGKAHVPPFGDATYSFPVTVRPK